MKPSIKRILKENNFIINDEKKAEITLDFNSEEEVEEYKLKINNICSNIEVISRGTSYENNEDRENNKNGWTVADIMFELENVSSKDIINNINNIRSISI